MWRGVAALAWAPLGRAGAARGALTAPRAPGPGGGAGGPRRLTGAARPAPEAEFGFLNPNAKYVHELTPLEALPNGGCRGTLWIDNLYPVKLGRFDVLWMLWRGRSIEKSARFRQQVHRELWEVIKPVFPPDITVKKVVPRLKDGGAFVTFERSTGSLQQTLATLPVTMKMARFKSRYSRANVRMRFVYGRPFVDDIATLYPSSRIRVSLSEPVPVEKVYRVFRHFGKIHQINRDGADYLILFNKLHGGVAARNCFHHARIGNAAVQIAYEGYMRPNTILKTLQSNPRASAIGFALMLSATTYVVFNPVRVFFVTNEITDWIDRKKFWRMISCGDRERPFAWSAQQEHIMGKLLEMLVLRPEGVTFLIGPKGSGKSVLIKEIEDQKGELTLRIDCASLLGKADESSFLRAFARSIGYYPAMSGLKWSMSLIEGLLGASAGQHGSAIQGNMEAEMNQMLDILEIALQGIRSRSGRYPIIILDGLTAHNAPSFGFYKKIARWSVGVANRGIAHVVFVSDSNFLEDAIHVEFSNTKVEALVMRDSSPADSAEYFARSLDIHGATAGEGDADRIRLLGGRLSDIDFVVQMVARHGHSVAEAIEALVFRAGLRLRQVALNEHGGGKVEWRREQLWRLSEMLVGSEEGWVDFDHAVASVFDGDDGPLRALSRAEIVHIEDYRRDGRFPARRVVFARPVYLEAVRRWIAEPGSREAMHASLKKARLEKLDKEIAHLESELHKLEAMRGVKILHGHREVLQAKQVHVADKLGRANREYLELSGAAAAPDP